MALGDVHKKISGTWQLQGNIRGATGATGATGDTGSAGADGADGATWFAQSTAPSAVQAGDLWLDTDDGNVYQASAPGTGDWGSAIANITGPTGATGDAGADGDDGADGADGTDGATWFAQSGTPTANASGDLWLDTDDGAVYMWNGSTWGSAIANLTGPTGSTGSAGADGADGAEWFAGASATGGDDGDFFLITS